MKNGIDAQWLAEFNAKHIAEVESDYAYLGDKLAKRGVDINSILNAASDFQVGVPTWGVGTGGTRFARFPNPGEPRNIFEKLDDCAVINQMVRCTKQVSPHFPWDKVSDGKELKGHADALGLGFDSVNSNTFQNQPGQKHSYKYGSLSHVDIATRDQAIEHNIECINLGKELGANALTVWIGDGSNFPGQQHFQRSLERYLDSMHQIYAALPAEWLMYIEHKMFEPAFYSTVIQDWGTSMLCAVELGDKAKCLVDLGHHAPNVNIEMIVSRLIQFKKLAGFHFNDSKYGDDDLDSGSINPYRQFLIFNELVDATHRKQEGFAPSFLLDQSHNVTDPIESLMNSAASVQQTYVQALLVDRTALYGFQDTNDALQASNALQSAYQTDVRSILAMARYKSGGAIDPIAAFRASGYRAGVAEARPSSGQGGSGIV